MARMDREGAGRGARQSVSVTLARAEIGGEAGGAPAMSRRLLPLYAALLIGNVAAWLWALAAFHGRPVLLGAAVLAYVFGLRHAVDADHIAAIDNVTRKLMRQGQKPVTVGLLFSLGHSTVVVIACVAIAMTSVALRARFAGLREVGAFVGTGVSAAFLFLIALANIVTLMSIYRTFRSVRGGGVVGSGFEAPAIQGGLIGRVLTPIMGFISRPWHMFPLGFLFGLGFDTASEIGLLGISASQASQNLPLWSIMIFPALFTAAMSLVDTTDGVVMAGAYGWAFVKPMRKLFYNFTITLISVAVALIVGALEALNLFAHRFALAGRFWDWVGNLNDHFGAIGCLIVVVLIACWGAAMLIYRHNRLGEADIRVG